MGILRHACPRCNAVAQSKYKILVYPDSSSVSVLLTSVFVPQEILLHRGATVCDIECLTAWGRR